MLRTKEPRAQGSPTETQPVWNLKYCILSQPGLSSKGCRQTSPLIHHFLNKIMYFGLNTSLVQPLDAISSIMLQFAICSKKLQIPQK